MRRLGRLTIAVALLAVLGLTTACQRTVEVQTGTRVVDSQGRVVSEDVTTLRVPPEEAGAYRINTISQEDAENPQLAAAYAEAQAAISSGDLVAAARKLDEVLAMSPSYRNAKKQSDAIKNGSKVTADAPANPKPSTSKPATTTTNPPATATGLGKWTPDTLTGFTALRAGIDPVAVSREYRPASGSAAQSLVIVAEQYRTSTAAKRGLTANVKQRYTKSVSSEKINGRTVYFATDGDRFAVAGFTSGAVMVAVEASSASGSPSGLKSLLERVVKQLP